MNFAGFGARFGARIIDGIIISIVTYPLQGMFGASGGYLVQTVVMFGYATYMLANMEGATVGKKVMKIKVVKEDGTALDLQTAAIREVSTILSGAILLLGYLYMLMNDKKQTLHDVIAKTLVVQA